MRSIDADALAELFSDRMEKVAERYGVYSSESGILSGAYKLLQLQPTIEPRKGKWIYPTDIKGFCRCENCKALWRMSLYENKFFRFCPRCGSDNRGEENE